MASRAIRCFDPKCKGVPFALNDGAARLAESFGRANYKCDKCHTRWSVDIKWYGDKLRTAVRDPSGQNRVWM